MKRNKIFIALALVALAVVGCVKEGSTGIGEKPDGDVAVSFLTGGVAVKTRAAFTDSTPFKLLVYRRDVASVKDLTVQPFKTVTGVTGEESNGLSALTFTGGDITKDNRLLVQSGYTYDFVIVVNAPSDAQKPSVGNVDRGIMGGIPHGVDLLASRKEGIAVNSGDTEITIKFDDPATGADDGNLPHLCSNIVIESTATQGVIDLVGNPFNMAIAGADFLRCLPLRGNLTFDRNPMALDIETDGMRHSYAMRVKGDLIPIVSTATKVRNEDGVLLPCPSVSGNNFMTIEFLLNINGANVVFAAPGLDIPEFKPGYQYTFSIELDADPDGNGSVNLYLSISKWNSVDWETGMGGDDDDDMGSFLVGTWDSVTWESGMGGDNDETMVVASVRGWTSIAWTSGMGEEN